ncbi:glycosyltransferase family 2 protein [Methanosarcina mazei]|uniref:Dolichyl-phosphate mannose synthase n=1 Tax=Methanosarcina mazei TaxID=2209 RepID=A0A0F8K5V5_METMZ|nr:glycosyltransferase family 2 protein [Methanosarcina mazei]KKG71271.1 dolichyl-phosphate mannose synthase [Methanosarcina mazei]KKG84699.1 dolichyl-phosphate mannose synthase [Methanosarcina mazei]KKH09217.1 dolichyl-phosphate mannose synthase [Methanosarcina mazei]KKH09878.1 dolichyl-phosphate mannose synthase [Methanosarcina mazei]MDO5841615.1 glycosyltransferase family 2 protein [Methanosarcina mazei]
MNIEVHMSKSTQIIQEEQGDPGIRSATPQNITVVLPAFNEEVSIGSIVLLTKHYCDNVIVVDDGSSDRTAAIARRAGAHVIVHEANKGKGAALKTGFKAAADLGADVIVTMDSDGQHNPAEIPRIAAPIIDGTAEMVNGSRYLSHKDKNTPIYRRVGQTILDTATNMNSGLKITDSQSGFRAFAASTKDVFRFRAQGMAIESEMLADAGRSGLRIREVEIGVRYDVDGSTISPIEHGLGVLVMVLKDIEFNKPLYYFTVPGISLGLGGLYMGAHFLETYFMGGGLNFGPTMLMILFIVIGTFMALTGILLHSVSAIARRTEAV